MLRRTHPKDDAGASGTTGHSATTSSPSATTPYSSSVLTMSNWSTKLLSFTAAAAFLAYFLRQPTDSYAVCSHPGETSIHTVDDTNSVVQCMLIHKDIIADTGDLDSIKQRNPNVAFQTRYVPKGSIVIPGISDSHCHILEYGASSIIPMSEGKNVKETVGYIKEYILSDPDLTRNTSKVVEGWGWDHASWDGKWPTWEDLEEDPIVSGRPIVLQSRDGHALWVSKATLEANAPFPAEIEGGIILRDKEGRPTGIFIDGAQALIKRAPPSDTDLKRRFQITVDHALASGLTSLHDAGFKPDSLAFFQRQIKQGNLPIRIYGMTHFNETDPHWGQEIDDSLKTGTGRLTVRSVKIFADGALRTGGAALYNPYHDNPTTSGVMRIPAEVLLEVIPRLMKQGWQVNVHAIGDKANGIVLDAFERGIQGVGGALDSFRPRLEHAQIMNEVDVKRLGKLGVIASVQPTHAISDMWFAEERLGPERVKDLYAFRSIIDNGARITLGSDFPVEVINPLKGFYAAITRLETDGTSPHGPGGWFPNQRLTRLEALRGMTIDPAYASFSEDVLGSIESGKRADYVVLERDIMNCDVGDVMGTRVLATVVDGRVVWGGM